MEKPFNILDNNMILVYDQQIPDHNVSQSSNSVGSETTEFAAELTNVQTEKEMQRNETKDDFLIESCSEYYSVENCVISGAKEMDSVAMNSSENEEKLDSQIGLDLELSRDTDCLKLERKCEESMNDCKNTAEMIEKDGDLDIKASTLQEATVHDSDIATIDNVTTNVLTNEDSCPVSVDSGLRFLNAGSSIVVLAQDPNNTGLSNIVSEMPIPCDREIGIESYEFSPSDANSLSTNVSENQPTFFQVELYSTNPVQSTACQDPATVISAQQVLTVPQLFSCQWEGCNTHFLCKDDLIAHVTSQHVKPIQPQQYKCLWNGCSREGRGFDARYKILTHLRSHTGERPHVCAVEGCHKSFARLDNLKIHMRSHTGERPYVCLYEGCNKSYANSSDRFKHRRTHLEKKPYRCKYEGCDKSYTDPSSLRKHHRRHQKEENKILSNESEPLVILPVLGND